VACLLAGLFEGWGLVKVQVGGDEVETWDVGSVVSSLSIVVSLVLGAGSWLGTSSFHLMEISAEWLVNLLVYKVGGLSLTAGRRWG